MLGIVCVLGSKVVFVDGRLASGLILFATTQACNATEVMPALLRNAQFVHVVVSAGTPSPISLRSWHMECHTDQPSIGECLYTCGDSGVLLLDDVGYCIQWFRIGGCEDGDNDICGS